MNGIDTDLTPVREHSASKRSRQQSQQQPLFQTRVVVDDVMRRQIASWQPEDLQNQYLVLYDDHQILKKHCRREEERIKRLQAELVKERQRNKLVKAGTVTVADVRHDQQVEKLTDRVNELERLNTRLKNRLEVQRQQVVPTSPLGRNSYRGVPSRVDTRLRRSQSGGITHVQHHTVTHTPRYGHSVLEETREEVSQLRTALDKLNEELSARELRIDELKEELRLREAEFDEQLLKIKQHATAEGRLNVQENLDLIKVQRELREKAGQLTQLHASYQQLEERQGGLLATQSALQAEVERLAAALKVKEEEALRLETQLRAGGATKRQLLEQDSHLADLQREVATLKETNEKLTTSAFNTEREREWRAREQALRTQVAQLEATLRRDVGEKGDALGRVEEERDKANQVEAELSATRVKLYELQQKHEELQQKMSFFSSQENGGVDMSEVEEALVLVKQRRDKSSEGEQLDFLQRVDVEENKEMSRRIIESEAQHAETIQELEKTRSMLFVQYRINNDYKAEVETISARLEDLRRDSDEKAAEAAQLLDLRAARIRKLERQLRDVAYGTRQMRVESCKVGEEEDETVEEELHLTRGENLLEIHIGKLVVTSEAQEMLQDSDPLLFATWDFFEFETQATAVMRGTRPDFDLTAQYVVKVDDFFLHYLLKDSATIELHLAVGSEYRTLGAGQLVLRRLLEKNAGEGQRFHSSVQLLGPDGDPVALLEYWARLRVGMEQSLRLYRERSKALGYLTANEQADNLTISALQQPADARPATSRSVNLLHVKVIRATGLRGRRVDVQPSPYFVYKLFDQPDHDSNIVVASNEPQFNDHRTYSLPGGSDLERYLRSHHLEVFVFDDTDPEPGAYLGRASLPLLPLAQNKPLAGLFELRAPDGGSGGSLEVELRWQDVYTASGSVAAAAEPLSLMAGEEEQLANVTKDSFQLLPEPERLVEPTPEAAPEKLITTPKAVPVISADTPDQVPSPVVRVADESPFGEVRDNNEALKPALSVMASPSGSVVEEPMQSVRVSRNAVAPSVTAAPRMHASEVAIPAPLDKALPRGILKRSGNITPSPANSVIEEPVTQQHRIKEPHPQINKAAASSPPPPSAPAAETTDTHVTSETFSEVTPVPAVDEHEEKIAGGRLLLPPQLDSDSDQVVVPASTRQSLERGGSGLRHSMDPADLVTIEVGYLELDEESSLFDSRDIKLYVEYRLPGISVEETETPFSLPVPRSNQRNKKMLFNFLKTFRVDFEENYQRRQHLAAMLLPDDPMQGRMRFTVVSEPSNDDTDECEELGHAFVSVRDILSRGSDYENEVLLVYSSSSPNEKLGDLCVTVQMLEALRAIQEEIQDDN